MIAVIEWIWFFSLLILTGYYMVVFRRRTAPIIPFIKEWPGVSIIIAHKNDSHHLIKNLKAISGQDYPHFEILIIDDGSSAEELKQLVDLTKGFENVNLLYADHPGKKQALLKGIHSAQHDLILCTDADCKPVSDQWIKKMVSSKRNARVVLGYSPYENRSGWLNMLIRFETAMTAIQYISWTLAGKPYMGVGRNMLYHRSLFLSQDPFKDHDSIPYGDDDLFIQAVSGNARVNVCEDPDSHVITQPPMSWNEWIRQKHRHMSAGYYYKSVLWWQPGFFGISLTLQWILIPLLIAWSIWWKWLPVFLIGLFIRWITYAGWSGKLRSRDTAWLYPLLEMNYALYLLIMGMYTIVKKKKTWS